MFFNLIIKNAFLPKGTFFWRSAGHSNLFPHFLSSPCRKSPETTNTKKPKTQYTSSLNSLSRSKKIRNYLQNHKNDHQQPSYACLLFPFSPSRPNNGILSWFCSPSPGYSPLTFILYEHADAASTDEASAVQGDGLLRVALSHCSGGTERAELIIGNFILTHGRSASDQLMER